MQGGASFGDSGILSQGSVTVVGSTTASGFIAGLFGGSVGIGATSTPGAALGVNGSGVFKGGLYIQATTTTSSLIASSTLSVASSSPTTNTRLTVAGNAYISQGLSVGRTATTTEGGLAADAIDTARLTISNRLDSSFTGTSTFVEEDFPPLDYIHPKAYKLPKTS